jgi:transcription initiation factor TFIIIB Brf1 subunit/transcription initiation factor TFIIB
VSRGRRRWWEEEEEGEEEEEDRRRRSWRRRNISEEEQARAAVLPYLELFHLGNAFVVEKVAQNYRAVYGRRVARRLCRPDGRKRRIAVAFSICNVLAREGMPRPASFIAQACGLEDGTYRPLLDLPRSLGLTSSDLRRLPRETYELLDPPPQDYIDTLCGLLGIPFDLATQMYDVAERLQWECHGRHPPGIAAAAVQHVLLQKGLLGTSYPSETICQAMGCQQRTVNVILDKMSAAAF